MPVTSRVDERRKSQDQRKLGNLKKMSEMLEIKGKCSASDPQQMFYSSKRLALVLFIEKPV